MSKNEVQNYNKKTDEIAIIDESNFSIVDIFKKIWANKIIFFIVSLVLFLIITLVLKYAVSDNSEKYSIDFDYIVVGEKEISNYPNGQQFNYRSFVSRDSLNTVHNSNSKYNKININKMLNNNDIEIINNYKYDSLGNYILDGAEYTLSIKASYFRNTDLARDFMIDLLNLQRGIAVNVLNTTKRDTFIKQSDLFIQYDEKLQCYYNQYLSLRSELLNLKLKLGDISVDADKNISTYISELDILFGNNIIKNLITTVETNGYIVNYNEYEKYANEQLISLNNQKKVNLNKIDHLIKVLGSVSNTGSGDDVSDEIIKLINEIDELYAKNETIENSIRTISNKLENYVEGTEIPLDFINEFNQIENNIISKTKELSDIIDFLNDDNTYIDYFNSSVITLTGGINIIFIFIFSFILSLVLGALSAMLIKEKKRKKLDIINKSN
ncbi:MAG: hypothetical protein ACRC5M_02200 [Anaeroplasmataceae bacterium]